MCFFFHPLPLIRHSYVVEYILWRHRYCHLTSQTNWKSVSTEKINIVFACEIGATELIDSGWERRRKTPQNEKRGNRFGFFFYANVMVFLPYFFTSKWHTYSWLFFLVVKMLTLRTSSLCWEIFYYFIQRTKLPIVQNTQRQRWPSTQAKYK